MNKFVFNQQDSPLYISYLNSNQTLSTNADIFTIGITNISLLTNEYHSIEILNPTNSKKTIYISNFTLLSSILTIKIKISFIKNGTLTSGSTVTPINNNFSSSNESVASVKYSTSAGNGTNSIFTALQYQSSYSQNLNSTICVPPGSTLLIRIQNLYLIVGSFLILVTWYEV